MTEQQPEWVQIADIPSQYDVTEFYHQLEAQGIRFRLRERGDMVELWVAATEDVREVVRMLQDYSIHHPPPPPPGMPQLGFKEQVQKMPVVVVLILLSIVGSAIVDWGFPLIHWFTFQDFVEVDSRTVYFGTLSEAMSNHQFWRLITPIFLHFDIFHLSFNGVLLWEFGRRIEPLVGSKIMAVIVLAIAIISNSGQYLWSGPALFGGMSGVVYGLLGYVWMRNKVAPRPILTLPNGLLVFMLVWLFAGMTGLIDLLMSGSIANAAHAAGLVSGMVLGIWSGKVEPGGDRQ